MALADLEVVYGGPYGDESSAIEKEIARAEAIDEIPDFDGLVSDWDTISHGAKEIIRNYGKPVEPIVGPFVNNVVIPEEEVKNVPLDEFVPTTTDLADDSDIFGDES